MTPATQALKRVGFCFTAMNLSLVLCSVVVILGIFFSNDFLNILLFDTQIR